MVVSFKISRRGRRFYPPPPAADPPPATPSPYGPPPPPRDAAGAGPGLGSGIAIPSGVRVLNGADPSDSDLDPSFALNLFPDGYSIGGLDKGMLAFLIGDDPEKKPYTRASRALLSDIEYGCLPQDILHGIPCKFHNGIVVCEVRDYRSFLSNGGDSSGCEFPKMNRVALRLGTDCVVKHLSLIADQSWTYHHQLIAESTIINSLQPLLNLDPTPCLEKLCNSVKKIDLGLNKGRQRTKDSSLLNTSTDPPEKYQPKERYGCEDAAVSIENSALGVLPTRILSSSPVICSFSAQVNDPKSTVVSDPEDTIEGCSTLRNTSALCDRKQSASSSPAPDDFLQNHEHRVELAIVEVDHKNGQSSRKTVLSQKRKQSSNLPCERRPSNKSTRLSFQSPKGQCQKSMGTLNQERLKLGSPKEPPVEVQVDQTIDKTDIGVNLDNHGMSELEGSAMTPVSSCSASSGKVAARPYEDKASTEPQPTTSKREMSGTSPSSLNRLVSFQGKSQKEADIQIRQPFEDGSSVEPGVTDSTSSQFGISPDIELCIGHPLSNIEPDIEKILSEVILTTQRHALNRNASKTEGVETSRPLSSCTPSHFFRYGSAEGSPYMWDETISCYPTTRTRNTRSIGRFVFHRVQYFCRGIIDQSHYILCLLESESPDDHQIDVQMILGDEHIHTSTLPTFDQARKLVDQLCILMKRDGYTLCNSRVCNGFSELTQQSGDVSQLGYLTGEHPQHQGFSPHVAKSIVVSECKDTSFAFQKRLPVVHANVGQEGSQQWGLPGAHANVLHQTSQGRGLPDVHANVRHQGSQQWGLPDAHAVVRQQGNTQQWRLPDAHANVRQQGCNQQWGLSYAQTNVLPQGSNQQRGLPYSHANVLHQGSIQQWGLPGAHTNGPHHGRQQWGLPDVHANLLHQGRQQWVMPDVHASVLHQGNQQWVQPGQSPTMASVDTSHFLNPSYPAEQQYNSRVLQQFPGGACSMDQHQHPYLQNRHHIPGSSERYATSMSTGSYDQWRQTPPQHGSRTYQWRFQGFGRQSNNMPQMHAWRSVLLSVPHRVGSPRMSSPTTGSDGSVTSFLVPPSGYQNPPHGNGIC